MKQIVQGIRNGRTEVRTVPDPIALPGTVVVANAASLISAGTERYVVELAKKSLVGKARERPDHVLRVLQKLRQEGLIATATQVMAKLDEPMPLGYSASGVVLACGADVQEFKPGDRVATAAPHAGVVQSSRNLTARLPEGVSFEQGAYAGVGAIALEGVRLTKVSLGERVLVIGLGLIGQMATALLKAQGCRVFGTDLDPARLELAKEFGADEVAMGAPRDAIMRFSDGLGVDAVVITAATDSNQPIELAADVARTKGRIVLVGVAGLNLPRPPFFKKELEFTVSSSLGPGRNDPRYEERGQDYPAGHVRWTAQRNMQAVLETIAAGKLPVERLTTHQFDVEDATSAYELVTSRSEPFYGILLKYPAVPEVPSRRMDMTPAPKRPAGRKLGLGLVGAGNFAQLVMLPILGKATGVELTGVASARGLNAHSVAQRFGFRFAATEAKAVIEDPTTDAVMIMTRHDQHADLVVAALRVGKHVFVEKPLAITEEGLEAVAETVRELGDQCPVLTVGFNRRFARATTRVQEHFKGIEPLVVNYRFAPGEIPADVWVQDPAVGGGRIVGEACHAIDTCAALVGSPPIRVYAESVHMAGGIETTDDRVVLTLRHANGALSSVSYQAGGDKGGPKERLEVFGGGRTAVLDEWDTIKLWSGAKRRTLSGGRDKGHATEVMRFVEAARNGGAWPIPWDELYSTSWASLMAVRSLREGLPVDPPW